MNEEEWRTWFRDRGWSIHMSNNGQQVMDPFVPLAEAAARPDAAAGREWLAAAYPKPTKHNRPEREQMRVWLIRVEAEAAARIERPKADLDAAALAEWLDERGEWEADTVSFTFDGSATPEGFAAAILARLRTEGAVPAAPAEPTAEWEQGYQAALADIVEDERLTPAAAEGPEPDVSFDSVAERHIREGTLTLPDSPTAGQSAGALRAALEAMLKRHCNYPAECDSREHEQARAALAAEPESQPSPAPEFEGYIDEFGDERQAIAPAAHAAKPE